MMKLKLKTIVVLFVLLFVLQIGKAQQTAPERRLTPPEIDSLKPIGAGAGTSEVKEQARVISC